MASPCNAELQNSRHMLILSVRPPPPPPRRFYHNYRITCRGNSAIEGSTSAHACYPTSLNVLPLSILRNAYTPAHLAMMLTSDNIIQTPN